MIFIYCWYTHKSELPNHRMKCGDGTVIMSVVNEIVVERTLLEYSGFFFFTIQSNSRWTIHRLVDITAKSYRTTNLADTEPDPNTLMDIPGVEHGWLGFNSSYSCDTSRISKVRPWAHSTQNSANITKYIQYLSNMILAG